MSLQKEIFKNIQKWKDFYGFMQISPSESLLRLLDMMLRSGDSSPFKCSLLFPTSLALSGFFRREPVSTAPFFPLELSTPLREDPGLLLVTTGSVLDFPVDGAADCCGGLHRNYQRAEDL